MVIQCPECSTRFKLSENKLKSEGIKIRCAKCRHIFPVYPVDDQEPVATVSRSAPPETPALPETPVEDDDLWGDLNLMDLEGAAAPWKAPVAETPGHAAQEPTASAESNHENRAIDEDALGLTELPKFAKPSPATVAADTEPTDLWGDFDLSTETPEPETGPSAPADDLAAEKLTPPGEPAETQSANEFLLLEEDREQPSATAEKAEETPDFGTETETPAGEEELSFEAFNAALDEAAGPEPEDEFLLLEEDREQPSATAEEAEETPDFETETEIPAAETPAGEEELSFEAFNAALDEAAGPEPEDELLLFEEDREQPSATAEEAEETPDFGAETETPTGEDELGFEALGATQDEVAGEEPEDEFLLLEEDLEQPSAAAEEAEEIPDFGTETETPAGEDDIFATAETEELSPLGEPETTETSSPEESSENQEEGLSLDAFAFDEEDTSNEEAPPEFSSDVPEEDDFFLAPDSSGDAFSFKEPGSSGSASTLSPYAETPPKDAGFDFAPIAFNEEAAATPSTEQEATVSLQTETPLLEKTPLPRPEAGADGAAGPFVLPKRPRKTPVSKVLSVFLVLLLGLVSAAGYLVWQRGATDTENLVGQLLGKEKPEVPVQQIHLTVPNSFFIMNVHAGQLFVIQGEAVNDYPETRSAISVKGILHDENKNVLAQQTVYCGNAIDPGSLRNIPFARLEEAMNNQFGDLLSNLNITPGKAIPYMIVFRDIPSSASEFTVEVVDSKPGGPP